MIGGSGEKKTFGLAARHFDHLNIIAGFDCPASSPWLAQRCEEVGRDPATLETSVLVSVVGRRGRHRDVIPRRWPAGWSPGPPSRSPSGSRPGVRRRRRRRDHQHARYVPGAITKGRRGAAPDAGVTRGWLTSRRP